MTEIIDGKAIADNLCSKLAEKVATLPRPPGLTAIIVGDDPASHIYVKRKEAMAKKIGIDSRVIRLPVETTQQELLERILWANENDLVDGILVQLPLPAHISTEKVIEAISPYKDVDGFHPMNAGQLMAGKPLFVPCTTMGILRLLEASGTVLEGTKVAMVGSGSVGRPTAIMLARAGATVTMINSKTRDFGQTLFANEIIVVAVGVPNLIRWNHVRHNSTIIDVGINRLPDGKIVGDVAFDECFISARAITPVPGGVGPMTIACLLENTVEAAIRRIK